MFQYLRKRWHRPMGLALFVLSQAVASAHALEFGAEPHEHHGVSCVAAVHEDSFEPPAADTAPQVFSLIHAPQPMLPHPDSILTQPLNSVKPYATGPPAAQTQTLI